GTNFKIDLHNSLMFDNVSIALFLERTGNTIYSRDSIINKAEFIIKKVQGIQFIHEYLKENPQRKLVLMFNNGASINNKIIERFNGTPESWERHDNYIKSFEWDKAHNIKLSFDIPKAIKTSERNECGCNFRLDNEYLRKGIYFQIFSEDGDRSDWILLPNDNKPILWFFQGQKVYRYTYKDLNTSGISVQHVCKYFDEKGNVINKK
ncbi:MAG: hypothetical protein Q8859_09645, partial [Bacteroidota bacterium]|nr:hypothetical protein [Bacteroidota bacterium]